MSGDLRLDNGLGRGEKRPRTPKPIPLGLKVRRSGYRLKADRLKSAMDRGMWAADVTRMNRSLLTILWIRAASSSVSLDSVSKARAFGFTPRSTAARAMTSAEDRFPKTAPPERSRIVSRQLPVQADPFDQPGQGVAGKLLLGRHTKVVGQAAAENHDPFYSRKRPGIGQVRVPAFQGEQQPIREKIIADQPQKHESEGEEHLPGLRLLCHPQQDQPD